MSLCHTIRQYGARVSLLGEPRFALVFTCMSYDVHWRIARILTYPDVQVVRCLLIEPNPESALNEDAARLFMEVGLGKTTLFRNKYGIYVREYTHARTHTHTHTFIYTWHDVCVLNKYVCIYTHTHTQTRTYTHIHAYIYVWRGASGGLVDLSHTFSQKRRTTSRTRREHVSWQAFTAWGRRASAAAPAWEYIYLHTYIHTYIHTYMYTCIHIHIYIYIYIHTYTYTCMYIYISYIIFIYIYV
jgi:hypothetical protein